MACMGPDTNHVKPAATALREAIIEAMKRNGITRPAPAGRFNIGKLDQKWDNQVVKLQETLEEMILLDTYASF